jgi:hypothetical protein
VKWNPSDPGKPSCEAGTHCDICADLYHELGHFADFDDGAAFHGNYCVTSQGNTLTEIDEVHAVEIENQYRAQYYAPAELRGCYYRISDPHAFMPSSASMCAPPSDANAKPKGAGCSGGCAIGVGVGASRGDPHLTTFDGYLYTLQAVGEFVLTRSPSADDLEVQVRQTPVFPGNRDVSVNTAFAANVAGDNVGVYLDASGVVVHVNHLTVDLSAGPVTLTHGGVVSLLGDGSIDVTWPDGSDLVVKSSTGYGLRMAMSLAPARAGDVTGLLGDFNGLQGDDLLPRGGAPIPLPPACASLYQPDGFADSWRVTAATSLFDYTGADTTATFTDKTFPESCVNADGLSPAAYAAARSICLQAGVYDPAMLDACILDVGATGQAVFALDAAATQGMYGTTLSIKTPNTTATLVFYGTAGQEIFIDSPFNNFPYGQCTRLALKGPDDMAVAGSSCIVDDSGFIRRVQLPATGLYALVLSHYTGATGDARVVVITERDQSGTISVGGPSVTAAINDPGQVARLSFTITGAPKAISVDVLSSTMSDDCGSFPPPLRLLDPAGTPINISPTPCILSGGKMGALTTTLSTNGQYTLVVDPSGAATGEVTLSLH